MAIVPVPLARVSNLLRSNIALGSIAKTQADLLDVQNQISTGKRVNSPSDDPGAAAIIQQLQKTLEQRTGFAANLRQANSQMGEVDSTLGDLTGILQQAQTIASANVGSDASPDQRKSAAAVVDSLYNQALDIANKQFNGAYLFGGDKSTSAPFVEKNGALQFAGSDTVLQNAFDENTVLPFMVDGAQVFGALSAKVTGSTTLGPALSASTRLIDIAGATGSGIQLGSIRIGNGATTADVDLSHADSLQDVVNAINGAGLAGVTASLGATGLQLTGAGDISVNEIGGGITAADLGILTAVGGGAGAGIAGQNLGAKVTTLTQLSTLRAGAGLDLSGLVLNNGVTSTPVSLTGATTVEDVLNRINSSTGGVQAQINAAGTGIDIVNINQTGAVTIAENGGATAAQLGVTTPSPIGAASVFANLAKLRDSLNASDQAGITAAATALQSDYSRIVVIRGQTGARVQELQARQTSLDNENLATKSLLSDLQDTDFTTAVTRFQQLQTQLQASYQATAQTLHLSLLDFLG